MESLTAWWLVLTGCGLAAWPLLATLRVRAVACGWALARTVGLLLLAYAYWLLNVAGVLGNSMAALRGVALTLAAAGMALWALRWRALGAAFRRDWRHILVCELLFAACLGLYALYKAHDPAIDHTEEPMDFAFLNALLRSPALPPRDPWLSGFSISYYYLGYLLTAVVARLSATAAGVAYNLGLAQSLALTALGAYGVLEGRRRPRATRERHWGWASALGALALVLVGNLAGLLEGLRALGVGGEGFYRWWGVPGLADAPVTGGWLPEGRWWWWRASRPFADVNLLGRGTTIIAEFPAFSYLLGDLHPHVMALPLVMLGLWLAGELYARAREGSALLLERGAGPLCAVAALLLGALGFANSWDLPSVLLTALAAIWLGWRRADMAARSSRRVRVGVLVTAGYLVVGSILFYLPFYRTLSSQASGVGLAYYAVTPLRSYLLVFGVWSPALLAEALRIWRAWRGRRRDLWLVFGAVLILPWLLTLLLGGSGRLVLGLGVVAVRGPWLQVVLAALIALYGCELLSGPLSDERRTWPHWLILLALGLTYAVEFVYLRDLFDTRMNTVFKLYYQAWALFALGALALLQAERPSAERNGVNATPGRVRVCVVRGLGALLVCLGLYYPVAAGTTRARSRNGAVTLDGTAYLAAVDPDAWGLYRWLERNAGPGDVVVEAAGDEYDGSTSRLSAWTGVPTVLGWPGHEAQWRGDEREVQARLADLDRLYRSEDAREVVALMQRYDATILAIGGRERALYGIDAERMAWYAGFMEPVYAQGLDRLYRLPAAF
ncbi:MAG: hypothetical protein GX557_08575 [Chloroflexi bacterium]|nr:hypothetical protein [Chloroflexota bacterium]